MPTPLALLIYDYVDDIVERREPHREAHLAAIRRDETSGRLVVAGALGDPVRKGLLAFRSPDDAERFVEGDPYVAAGLVTNWRIEPWNVVAGSLSDDDPRT